MLNNDRYLPHIYYSLSIAPHLAVVHGLEDKKISEGQIAQFTVQLNQANVIGDWYLNGLKLISR